MSLSPAPSTNAEPLFAREYAVRLGLVLLVAFALIIALTGYDVRDNAPSLALDISADLSVLDPLRDTPGIIVTGLRLAGPDWRGRRVTGGASPGAGRPRHGAGCFYQCDAPGGGEGGRAVRAGELG